jgi:hypothetical protein
LPGPERSEAAEGIAKRISALAEPLSVNDDAMRTWHRAVKWRCWAHENYGSRAEAMESGEYPPGAPGEFSVFDWQLDCFLAPLLAENCRQGPEAVWRNCSDPP